MVKYWRYKRRERMTEQEQNMVNRLKMTVARMILDLDDEAVLEVIKKVTKERETEKSE